MNMQRLAQEFGSDWAQQHLVPHILAMAKNGNYLYRMTVLASLAQLAPHVSVDVCCNSMLPVVLAAAKDRCVRCPPSHSRAPNASPSQAPGNIALSAAAFPRPAQGFWPFVCESSTCRPLDRYVRSV